MGASGWNYRVPYQEDLDGALQDLRRQVLASGDYYKVWEESGREVAAAGLAEMAEMMEQQLDEGTVERLAGGAEPTSIDEAMLWSMDSGTHSVLDVAAVTPLDGAAVRDLLGTAEPTSAMVEEAIAKVLNGIERWSAVAITAYVDGRPEAIHVVGISGD